LEERERPPLLERCCWLKELGMRGEGSVPIWWMLRMESLSPLEDVKGIGRPVAGFIREDILGGKSVKSDFAD
jgi:hypothetical protein